MRFSDFCFYFSSFPLSPKKRRNVATLRVRQILWILSQTSDGGSDLRLVDQRTQRVVETWPLPSGRWWAPGEEKGGGLLGSAFSKLCQGSLGGGKLIKHFSLGYKESHEFTVFF